MRQSQKSVLFQVKLPSLPGRGSYQADYLTSADREIPDCFKIPLLEEAEAAVRLDFKLVGLSK